jgi:hypothetical protein
MTKTNRKAAREARKVIRFTLRKWNAAQLAAWDGGYGSSAVTAFDKVSRQRLDMITPLAAPGSGIDHNRLRKALRAVEVG